MNSFETIYDFTSGDGFKKFQILLIPIGIFLFLKFISYLIENDKGEDLFKDPVRQKFIVQIFQYLSIFLFFYSQSYLATDITKQMIYTIMQNCKLKDL